MKSPKRQNLGEKFVREHFHSEFVARRARRNSFSSLSAAVLAARETTARDPVTGKKVPGKTHGSWLGALGYFTVLDQIGTCFHVRGKPLYTQGVRAALSTFTDLSGEEVKALYALRCCFAHDFSLFNRPEKRRDLWHRFAVAADDESPLVWLPCDPWDGDPLNDNPRVFTMVNLAKFGDLVEQVLQKVIDLIRERQVEVRLNGGVKELSAKYWHSRVNVGRGAGLLPKR